MRIPQRRHNNMESWVVEHGPTGMCKGGEKQLKPMCINAMQDAPTKAHTNNQPQYNPQKLQFAPIATSD